MSFSIVIGIGTESLTFKPLSQWQLSWVCGKDNKWFNRNPEGRHGHNALAKFTAEKDNKVGWVFTKTSYEHLTNVWRTS